MTASGFSILLLTHPGLGEGLLEAARAIDDRTITLQYFEALKQLGESPATKYVVPLELTDLARRLGNFLDGGLDTGAAVRLSVEPESSGEDDRTRDS